MSNISLYPEITDTVKGKQQLEDCMASLGFCLQSTKIDSNEKLIAEKYKFNGNECTLKCPVRNNRKNGKATIHLDDGYILMAELTFTNGILSGEYTLFEKGEKCEWGTIVNGKKEGRFGGKVNDTDIEGEYISGKRYLFKQITVGPFEGYKQKMDEDNRVISVFKEQGSETVSIEFEYDQERKNTKCMKYSKNNKIYKVIDPKTRTMKEYSDSSLIIYEGGCLLYKTDFLRHGTGKEYIPDEKRILLYEGPFQYGFYHGENGRMYKESRALYNGSWEYGYPMGCGTLCVNNMKYDHWYLGFYYKYKICSYFSSTTIKCDDKTYDERKKEANSNKDIKTKAEEDHKKIVQKVSNISYLFTVVDIENQITKYNRRETRTTL